MRPGIVSHALRFLCLGALLVAADRVLLRRSSAGESERGAIEIDAERIDALRKGWIARGGTAPDHAVLAALIEAEIDDEILLREARKRGFESEDPVVRARLARNVGFISGADERAGRAGDSARVDLALALGIARGDLVVRRRLIERMRAELGAGEHEPPSEREIDARFARDRELWLGSPRLRLSHVFLSRDRRGAALVSDALALRREIAAGRLEFADAIARGDPFLLGHSPSDRSQAELSRSFGAAFAIAVFALEPGQVSEPIESPYGLHLVRVHERTLARPAELEAARARIAAELARERADGSLRVALSRLRDGYEIRIAKVER
ncbi:MAG: peptidyl-prolyl cis-trans isomerase [Deltaproteobacteria bacterium]|nr:peptidyl-prolyl cis-trans isomerase [Deltaproteobacteria bacterium]